MTSALRFVAACATFAAVLLSPPAFAAEGAAATSRSVPVRVEQIQPGDQIQVEVFGSPDLATSGAVAEDGSLRMPLVGDVSVAGRSPVAAAQAIETALKSGEFLVNPHVTVTVVAAFEQLVTVLGKLPRLDAIP